MKKYFLVFLLSLSLFGGLITRAVAAPDQTLLTEVANKSTYAESTDELTLSQNIGKVIKVVLGLLGIVFLVLTVYAGVLWMTAAGEEEKITKATGILRTTIIGLIIILMAYSLTYFVLDKVFEATLG